MTLREQLTPEPPTLEKILLGRIRGESGLSDDDLFEWLAVLDRLKRPLIEPMPTLLMVRTTTKKLADDNWIVWEGSGWSPVRPAEVKVAAQQNLF